MLLQFVRTTEIKWNSTEIIEFGTCSEESRSPRLVQRYYVAVDGFDFRTGAISLPSLFLAISGMHEERALVAEVTEFFLSKKRVSGSISQSDFPIEPMVGKLRYQ